MQLRAGIKNVWVSIALNSNSTAWISPRSSRTTHAIERLRQDSSGASGSGTRAHPHLTRWEPLAGYPSYPESKLGDTAVFEPPLVNPLLGPGEWLGGLVVCRDEGIDVLLQLLDGGE